MKDSKFQELVNLYLDQEISEGDLRRLRKEVGQNPERLDAFNQTLKFRYVERAALNPQASHFYAKELARLRSALLSPSDSVASRRARLQAPRPSLQGAGLVLAACMLLVLGAVSFFETRVSPETLRAEMERMTAFIEGPAPVETESLSGFETDSIYNPSPIFNRELSDASLAANFNLSGLKSQVENSDPFVLSATFGQAYQRMLQDELSPRESAPLILVLPRKAIPIQTGGIHWREPEFQPITIDDLRRGHLTSARRMGLTHTGR